jgi:regulator of replication initiation timing
MSAADTIKDVVRIATAAGLAKDVIDLLDKKAALLAEQVAALDQENGTLLLENHNLKLENENLQKQLENAHAKDDELDETTAEILKLFFENAKELSDEQIASHFRIKVSVASYHTDILLKNRLIWQTSKGISSYMGTSPAMFSITAMGRRYVVEKGLAG